MPKDLDEFMATEVMGWDIAIGQGQCVLYSGHYKNVVEGDGTWSYIYIKNGEENYNLPNYEIWHPTEDMNQALTCLEKMNKTRYVRWWKLEFCPFGAFHVLIRNYWDDGHDGATFTAEDKSAPQAICETIRKAVGK